MSWVKPLKQFGFLILFVLLTPKTQAIEIQPFYGPLKYERIDGCCQSDTGRNGTGVLVRLNSADFNEWDVIGYTDRKWSQFSVLKPIYVWGSPMQNDPSLDSAIQIQRLQNWVAIVSLGGGYFIHSTRTILYDLPALVSGFTIEAHSQLRYTINDTWSVVGSLHLGLSAASDDRGFLSGVFLGFNYRP